MRLRLPGSPARVDRPTSLRLQESLGAGQSSNGRRALRLVLSSPGELGHERKAGAITRGGDNGGRRRKILPASMVCPHVRSVRSVGQMRGRSFSLLAIHGRMIRAAHDTVTWKTVTKRAKEICPIQHTRMTEMRQYINSMSHYCWTTAVCYVLVSGAASTHRSRCKNRVPWHVLRTETKNKSPAQKF